MSRGEKANFDEIFERLVELEGDVRAIRLVMLRHIFRCDWVLRGHAEALADSIESDITDLPRVPPNARLLEALDHILPQIRQISRVVEQAQRHQDDEPPP